MPEVFIEIGDHEIRHLAHSGVEQRIAHHVQLAQPTCCHPEAGSRVRLGRTQRILAQIQETLATSFYFLREVFLRDFLVFL